MTKKIISVGHPEFPLGLAQVQRQLLLARAILQEGWEVTVLCRYGIHRREDKLPEKGVVEGVEYIYCSGTTFRPDGFIRRNLLKIRGLIKEICLIRQYHRSKQLAGMLVSTNDFHNAMLYFLLGKAYGITTVLDVVEYWSAYTQSRGPGRMGKAWYDRNFYRLANRMICISDFLIRLVPERHRHRVIKIPPVTDFDKFVQGKENSRMVPEKYFLFCGSSDAYFEIIEFVISAFEQIGDHDIKLVLVTKRNQQIDDRLRRSEKRESVIIRSGVPYDGLVNLYMNSEALIIPMRDTDQDRARFPHKISEYCASGRPIITNNVGEIKNYFNEMNAFVRDEFTVAEYSQAMNDILTDPEAAEEKARNSYRTGMQHFNYKSYARSLTGLFAKE